MKHLPNTFVEGPLGVFWMMLNSLVHSKGVYSLFLKQGGYHGAGYPNDESNALPIIYGWETYSRGQLKAIVKAHLDAYKCCCFHLSGSQALYANLTKAFQNDLDVWVDQALRVG